MNLKHRRHTLTALAALALGAWGASVRAAPGYRVTAAQLQQVLAARFPLRYALPGLFDLTLEEPQLRLLPEENRLGTRMLVRAAGPALRRPHGGDFDLEFALRYEPADRSIRAQRLRVQSLHIEGLPPRSAALLQRSATDLAEQQMLEIVLHRMKPADLALADTMGLQPGDITVTPDGLLIGFVNKTAS